VLEDELGEKAVWTSVGRLLSPPGWALDAAMRDRLRFLDGIPFRAILTTNYDPLFEGAAPFDLVGYSQDSGTDMPTYADVLRPAVRAVLLYLRTSFLSRRIRRPHAPSSLALPLLFLLVQAHATREEAFVGRALALSTRSPHSGRPSGPATPLLALSESDCTGAAGTSSAAAAPSSVRVQEWTLRSTKERPIIKLHGSITATGAIDNAAAASYSSSGVAAGYGACSGLVMTRSGYRRLLHTTPGYMPFLRAVLSTCTVLYLGFSFSDGAARKWWSLW
jgi:hypothetical protein